PAATPPASAPPAGSPAFSRSPRFLPAVGRRDRRLRAPGPAPPHPTAIAATPAPCRDRTPLPQSRYAQRATRRWGRPATRLGRAPPQEARPGEPPGGEARRSPNRNGPASTKFLEGSPLSFPRPPPSGPTALPRRHAGTARPAGVTMTRTTACRRSAMVEELLEKYWEVSMNSTPDLEAFVRRVAAGEFGEVSKADITAFLREVEAITIANIETKAAEGGVLAQL